MSTWIETSVTGRLVIEVRRKELDLQHPEDFMWGTLQVLQDDTSIEKGREFLANLPKANEFVYRLVWERIETRREDVTE